jgi:hypothetical protein
MAKNTRTTADSHNLDVDRLIADFDGRIAILQREGVPSYPPLGGRKPWATAPETDKLEQIVWESMNVWLSDKSTGTGDPAFAVIAVPGAAALEAVERHVDYAGLPAVQREMLQDLRAGLDAGQFGGPPPKHKDAVADALERVVSVGHFDRMVQDAKESELWPWAEISADRKMWELMNLAAEAWPPVAYTLAVIEREVDVAQLTPGRKQALEGVRERLDCDGHDPLDPDGRADLALRLAELEARVEHYKHSLWGSVREELKEDVKFEHIVGEIGTLHLESEAAAYLVIDREVEVTRLPEEKRREFEADRFDSVAANLRQQWYDDGLGAGGDRWEDQPTQYKVSYLADFAGAYKAPFERFAEAARPLLGMAPGEEFTADQEWVKHEFHASSEKYESRQAEVEQKAAQRQLWPSEIAAKNRQKQPAQDQGKGSGRDKDNGRDDGHSM